MMVVLLAVRLLKFAVVSSWDGVVPAAWPSSISADGWFMEEMVSVWSRLTRIALGLLHRW